MNAPSIQLTFDFAATPTGIDKAVALLKYADKLGVPPSEDSVPPVPPAPKPKPAPAAATPAKGKAAAKTNSKAKPKEPDLLDLNNGDEDEDEEETGGLGLADDEDEPEEEFDGTPEEAKEEALAKLRTMLSTHKDQVKEVQKIMKVAKFHDVPAEKGFEFLRVVKQIEAKIARN